MFFRCSSEASVGLAVLALMVLVPWKVEGHAWMVKPASREHVAWTRGQETEPQSAGGPSAYGPCGVVKGRDYMQKAFDTAVAGMPGNRLRAGGVVEIEVAVTAHHKGHFEFHLCTDASRSDVWECLKEHKLVRSRAYEAQDPAPIHAEYPERWYLPPSGVAGWPLGASSPGVAGKVYRMWFELPRGVSCVQGQCLLQFFYYSGNSCTGKGYNTYYTVNEGGNMVPPNRAPGTDGSWTMGGTWWTGSNEGTCYDGSSGQITSAIDNKVSLGTPERFWNCADVSVDGSGPSPPSPSSPSPSPSSTPVTSAPVHTTPAPSPRPTPVPWTPPRDTPTPPRDTPAPSTPPTSQCSPSACRGAGYESCGRCTGEFVHCAGVGWGYRKTCPPGLVWDARITNCNWPQAVGCVSAAAENNEEGKKSQTVVVAAAVGGAMLVLGVVGVVAKAVLARRRAQRLEAEAEPQGALLNQHDDAMAI